ncbi:MAG TPA: hypothetical protein PK020_18350 [Ilumatobacteraceae bacterium]|nr:hypothetical protein [Ilumatobacteraceae bacterium]HRB04640.1 hypothetical protein [Ilumatobacteraceae bacterium]
MSVRRVAWLVRAALALPFVVALIVLATTHWSPVLDLAMTEFRVRDVFSRHTPLIGLPGRIGTFPNQGSHPGPLSFYLLAPVYRLLGSTAYSLLVGAAIINVGAAWTAVWVAQRRGGRRLVLGVGAVVMVLMAWLGASVLTQPWNPYLPLVSFVVVLLSTWAVLDGDHRMLIPLVVAATLGAQTHVPYLSLNLTMCAVAFGAVGWRWWKARAADRGEAKSVVLSVAVGVALWLPVFVDQVRHDPGNITMLQRHFLNPPEPPVGWGVGIKTVLAHFDVTHVVSASLGRSDYFIDALDGLAGGRWVIGALVLLAWLAAVAVSVRLADHRILRLHVVVGVAAAIGLFSTARIFGKVWYYLTLWSWSIALLAVAATIWTFVSWWEAGGRARLPIGRVAVVATLLAGAVFVVDAAKVSPPEERLSRVLNAVVDPTAHALRDGVGAADGVGGSYAVYWSDAYYFGSQGFGLLDELERRGFDARASDTYRVPVTPHRVVRPGQVTAEVVLATGIYVAEWRARTDVVEVADFEPRSAAELQEFNRLRSEAIERLTALGLDDVVAMIDSNLFSARIDPRVPGDVERMLVRMLVLGEETAVFIAPPGTF